MKTKVPKGLYLVPVLYLGIIAIFIYLQFSGVDTFTSTVSHLTAMGQISKNPLSGDDNISDLQIFGTGILFPMDNKNPVRIYSSDGLVHKAEPYKYRSFAGRLEIEMTSGLTLKLTPEEENPESVIVDMVFPEYSSIKSVSIPFSLMRDFYIESTGSLPVYSISDRVNKEVTMLTLPMGASLDKDSNRITIPCGENGITGILVERTGDIQDPLSFWFSKKADLLTDEEYNLFLEDFLSKAMEGWRNSRYNTQNGTWNMPEGDPVFSDRIAAILLSEAMTDNEFRPQYERMNTAKENARQTLSLLTMPFLGDIEKISQSYAREEKNRLQKADRMISERNMEVFRIRDLYSLIHIHGTADLAEDLVLLAETGNSDGADMEAVSGLLKYQLDRYENDNTNDEIPEQIEELAAEYILPGIQVLQEGFFLESNTFESDLLLSVQTGVDFIRCGKILDRQIFSILGKELIHSVLKKADILGIIPAVLHFEDGHIITRGDVPPEEIYPLLFTNDYYPGELSGSPEGEPGTWIYTSSPEMKTVREGNTVKYIFKYKPGEIHYILIQGVKPFTRMKLLGLNWKPDPIFYRYYSGWYYDSKSESLYIKIRNKAEEEEIILYY